MTEITSRENPCIKEYIKLRDNKKFRSEEGLFVLEGARIAMDAVNENVGIKYGFVTDEAFEKYPDTCAALEKILGRSLYLVSDSLSDKLSDTKGSQGIFLCAYALDKIQPADKINKGGKYLVLDNLQDPGNVGTIIRAADAVGIDGIFLCNCCDIYNPKTIRSTMGSVFRVPFWNGIEYSEAVNMLRSAGIVTYASVVDKDALDLKETVFENNCAVVIGNEGNGLSKADVELCDKKVTIRMKGNINSLNAASAAGIFLWEMTK